MQAKPLAITVLVLGLLALGADIWLAHSSGGRLAVEKSQVTPALPVAKPDTVMAEKEPPLVIFREDSLETTRSVTQKIQDLVLIASIEKRLFRASELRGIEFEVTSTNGAVALDGKVATEKEKQRALRLAQSVAGVKSVSNHIQVVVPPVTSEAGSE